ncbi:MAG: S24 family peptidase [Jatrophihabitans sp.]
MKRDFPPVLRVLLSVTVSGPSMVPTLRHGDVLIAVRAGRVRPGDVVLARFRTLPERLVVKRVVRRVAGAHGDGWWLASDNPFVGGDSETNGVADVVARVRWRVRPGRPQQIRRRTS